MEILLAEELFGTAEIDLATADPAKVQIRCGEFATGAGTTGTLTAKYLTDKFGTIEGLIVALDASKDGKRLRAAYEGTFAGGYAATNTIKVTEPRPRSPRSSRRSRRSAATYSLWAMPKRPQPRPISPKVIGLRMCGCWRPSSTA